MHASPAVQATQVSLSFHLTPISVLPSSAFSLICSLTRSSLKYNNKTFSCVLGIVLKSYVTKHEIIFSSPKFFSPSWLIYFSVVSGGWAECLMICCVCSSPYPSPYNSSPCLLFFKSIYKRCKE